jgi:hypothetical protein
METITAISEVRWRAARLQCLCELALLLVHRLLSKCSHSAEAAMCGRELVLGVLFGHKFKLEKTHTKALVLTSQPLLQIFRSCTRFLAPDI